MILKEIEEVFYDFDTFRSQLSQNSPKTTEMLYVQSRNKTAALWYKAVILSENVAKS